MSISTTICAVIVTYNRVEKLKETLDAYLLAGIEQLVVVNNASTDGTQEFLCSFNSDLCATTVLTMTENLGGAGGFHAGLQYARDNIETDWIVVSDDDSYPDSSSLTAFKAELAMSVKCSLFASAVYYPTGEICLMNQPMLISGVKKTLANLFKGNKLTGLDKTLYQSERSVEITASSFVGLFIKRDALLESKVLPDPNFFLYWDDIAFCLDMGKRGYSLRFLPLVSFVHDCARHSQSLSEQRLYYMVRNGLRVILRLPTYLIFLSLPIKLLIWANTARKEKSLIWFIKALRDV